MHADSRKYIFPSFAALIHMTLVRFAFSASSSWNDSDALIFDVPSITKNKWLFALPFMLSSIIGAFHIEE